MMRLFVLILGLLILISSCKVSEGKPEVAKNDGLRNKYASIVGVSKSEINNVKCRISIFNPLH